jgi:hypothetical protein
VDASGNTREKYVHVIRVATPNLRRVFCKSDCSKVNHKLLLLIKQKIGKNCKCKNGGCARKYERETCRYYLCLSNGSNQI